MCKTIEFNSYVVSSGSLIDNQTRPLLSYSETQSRSVLLSWRVSNGRYDRFNHFIIYYRRLPNSNESNAEQITRIHSEDYKQILVDPRTTKYSFTFRVNKHFQNVLDRKKTNDYSFVSVQS